MQAQQTTQVLPQDSWIVDSGASHHMTADVTSLSQVIHFQGSENITIGNGSSLAIQNIGSTTIQTNNHSLILSKVLHIPNIARSLLSVKQLCADNNRWLYAINVNFLCRTRRHGNSKLEELFQIPVL